MSKQVKKVYRGLAWFFSAVIAAGTFLGCAKYGPPRSHISKEGTMETTRYDMPLNTSLSSNVEKDINS